MLKIPMLKTLTHQMSFVQGENSNVRINAAIDRW